jgi:Glycosyl hydrolase catalytic core
MTFAALALVLLGGCGGGGEKTPTGAAKPRATPKTPAPAGKAIGIGDQGAAVFAAPLFRQLRIDKARLVVPWDTMQLGYQQQLVDQWLTAAKKAGVEPFVSFSASRRHPTQLPTVTQFKTAFLAFRRRWPQVRVYAAWNEINHKSQPTSTAPARAAAFYDVVRDNCPGCTVVAADVLDQAGFADYLRRFRAAVKGPAPELWGLHNYSDTNRFRTSGTRSMLRAVPGEIWVTETGGVAKFGRDFPFDLKRQARATAYTFHLLDLSSRIRRLYVYNWAGAPPGARFDSGLTNADGTPRPAYRTLARELR